MGMDSEAVINEGPAGIDADRSKRFGAYFPRVFAYVRGFVDDDETAREAVTSAFARVFSVPVRLGDEEFPVLLFGFARDVCKDLPSRVRRSEGTLTSRERDVISLLFDAQLTRKEIGCVLDMRAEAVSADLLRGLRKLRPQGNPISSSAAVRPA